MMKALKTWSFMRILRLVFGLFGIGQAIYTADVLLGVLALGMAGMAIFNVGCCASGACSTPFKNNTSNKDVEVQFEEVKVK